MYTATNPAAGVRVDPLPRFKQHLPFTQAKNARKMSEGEGVLRPVPIVKGVGLGMPSTIRTLPTMIIPTRHAHPQTIRPGTKRRGHCKAPSNLCCSAPMRSKKSYEQEVAGEMLHKLTRMHTAILRFKGDSRSLERKYERNRRKFITDFPQMSRRLEHIEREHERSVQP